ncbi:MAG TPA: EAL domain-containing protein, partial [Novosphingobium sp.]
RWPRDLRLSLNVTSADLAGASFSGQLLEAVEASGFAPTRLTVEVTEQALIGDIATARIQLEALAAAGIRIALDDFGAGFCNFRYLKLLPLHYLKLDRTMVDGIGTEGPDLAVFRAIVAMARALQLDVIAEGIEDEIQQTIAAREGCAAMQGFLRARPMRADDVLRFAGG